MNPDGGGGATGGSGGTGGAGTACGPCGGDTPVCNETTQTCVQCTADNVSACSGETSECDLGSSECVECLSNATCTDPAEARCDPDTNRCSPCEIAADCTGIAGLDACTPEGLCAPRCEPATEDEDCEGNTCNPATFTCTATEIGGRKTCETCVSDSDCGDDETRCIATEYQGVPYPNAETGFCLRRKEAGCMQPFVITLEDRVSFTGPPVEDYCGIREQLTTCTAVLALRNNELCEDDQCPHAGGICREVGGTQPPRCTYVCEVPIQCPSEQPLNTCGSSGSGGTNYCGG